MLKITVTIALLLSTALALCERMSLFYGSPVEPAKVDQAVCPGLTEGCFPPHVLASLETVVEDVVTAGELMVEAFIAVEESLDSIASFLHYQITEHAPVDELLKDCRKMSSSEDEAVERFLRLMTASEFYTLHHGIKRIVKNQKALVRVGLRLMATSVRLTVASICDAARPKASTCHVESSDQFTHRLLVSRADIQELEVLLRKGKRLLLVAIDSLEALLIGAVDDTQQLCDNGADGALTLVKELIQEMRHPVARLQAREMADILGTHLMVYMMPQTLEYYPLFVQPYLQTVDIEALRDWRKHCARYAGPALAYYTETPYPIEVPEECLVRPDGLPPVSGEHSIDVGIVAGKKCRKSECCIHSNVLVGSAVEHIEDRLLDILAQRSSLWVVPIAIVGVVGFVLAKTYLG